MKKNRTKKRPQGGAGRSASPAAVSSEPDVAADRPRPAGGGWLRMMAAGLFGAALGIAGYLAWQSAAGKTMPGCGPESGCGQILGSRWSLAGAVPVSLAGGAVYAVLLISSLTGGKCPRWRRRVEWGASVLVLGAALWFTIVQAFIVKAFCPWCCATHLFASAGVVLLWCARRKVPDTVAVRPGFVEFALPLAAVAGLAILQSLSREPGKIVEKSLSQPVVAGAGSLSLYNGRLVLDSAALPYIGVPGAVVTAVALTDFTCPHCRELHQTLTRLAGQRPGEFSAVLLPAAFDPDAVELHRMMLSLWRIDSDAYRKLADELADGVVAPNIRDVLAAVQKHLQGRFYELAWPHADWVHDTLRKGEELMALNAKEAGAATLPQLMLGDRILTGAPPFENLVALLDAAPAAAPSPLPIASPPPPLRRAVVANSAPAPAASAPAVPGPAVAISFESTIVDFGTVARGEPAAKKVTFTNTGREPLIVSHVRAGCACTKVEGGQQTVAPGQQGSFEVKIDTGRFIGAFSKTVEVESNAAGGMVSLTLKANIWCPVTLFPSSISFGTVLKGAKVESRAIDISATDPEPLKPGGVSCSNPYLQPDLKTIEEGRKYRLTVSVPELGERPQSGDVVLALGHPRMKELKLPVFVNPVDPIAVQPAEFIRMPASLKNFPSTSVTVYCHDPALATLEVTDLAYSGGGGVTVAFARQGNNKWGRINLTFPPGFAAESAKDAEVTFRTNHPAYPRVSVPVRFAAPAPNVAPPPAAGNIPR